MPTSVQLVPANSVDFNAAVLVDGQTILSTRPEYFISRTSERKAARYDHDDLMPLYNFIQNLVIYDRVLVDSQLLALEQGCEGVCALFQRAISGLLINGKLRAGLADEVTEFINSEELIEAKLNKRSRELLAEMARNDAEIRQYYSQVSGGWFPDDIATELRNQASLLGETLDEYVPRMTMFTGTRDRSLERTHFYLELSRALGIYLSPHPIRAEYFKRTISKTLGVPNGFAGNAVKFVDKKMQKSATNYFLNAHWNIPPVAEYVLRIADERDADLVSAIFEVRESKHARDFRRWCSEMSGTIRQGRSGMAAAQKVYAELERECSAWQRDVNEHVKYQHRTLSLGDFWFIGKILKVFGMEKVHLKDPVIAVDKPYLLLLNDLYRPRI
jgi:hypothetical protein